MTRYLMGLGVLLVIGGIAAGLWFLSPVQAEDAAASPRLLTVTVAKAKAVDRIRQPRQFTGTLKPRRESQLSFERSGRLVSIHFDEGDRVEQGEVLATIDVDSVRAELEAATAQLEQAVAVLAELEAGPRKQTIAAAESRVVSLASLAEQRKSDFDRATKLMESKNNSISAARFDSAKFQFNSALADRDAAQRQLDELLAGTRKEQLSAQRATVRRLRAEVRRLELDVEDGTLLAPFSGRIAERMADEGTVLSPNAVVFRLVEDTALEAWVGVPAATARQMNDADDYTVVVDGMEIKASLASLRPQLDPITRTRNAILTIDQKSSRSLVPGQIVRLRVIEEVAARGVKVPATALVPGPRGLWKVYVAVEAGNQTVIESRNVELLYSLDDRALVIGTVREGEAIVTSGIHRVVAGQVVATSQESVSHE